MKRTLMMACALTAALMMTEGVATAGGCGYGGYGYGGYGYGSPGLSIGYSSYAPRSSFSIGYSSYPSYRTRYRARSVYPVSGYGYGYAPHVHVSPRTLRSYNRRW